MSLDELQLLIARDGNTYYCEGLSSHKLGDLARQLLKAGFHKSTRARFRYRSTSDTFKEQRLEEWASLE